MSGDPINLEVEANPIALDLQVGVAGVVTGPSSATDNAVVRYDGTTGKLLQSSPVTISDAGAIAGMTTVDGRDVSVDGAALDAHTAAANPHSGSQPLDADLTALAALSTTGLVARTGSGTYTPRTITSSSSGLTVANGDGVSGNPALTLVAASSSVAGVVQLGTEVPAAIVLSSTVSDSAAAGWVTAGNLSFTPTAGGIYLIEIRGVFHAAASTTGFQFLLDPGNGTGGGIFQSRGSSSTASAFLLGILDGTTGAAGSTSPAIPGNECGFQGMAIVTAHASAPTALSLRFQSEVGSSEVTLTAGKVVLLYRRLA